jgi:hypothetical protein
MSKAKRPAQKLVRRLEKQRKELLDYQQKLGTIFTSNDEEAIDGAKFSIDMCISAIMKGPIPRRKSLSSLKA